MKKKETQVNIKNEIGFPHWNMGQVLLFLFLFWIFTQIVGFSFTVIFVLFNKWLNFGLDNQADVFVGRYLSALFCQLTVIIFLKINLRHFNQGFSDVWGKRKSNWYWIIGASILGLFLAIINLSLRETSSSFDIPSIYPVGMISWFPTILEFCVIVIATPIVEEILFRGVLFRSLYKNNSSFFSIILSALIFMVYHIPIQINNPLGLLMTFMIGMGTAYLLYKTGSLSASIVLHILYNATIILFAK